MSGLFARVEAVSPRVQGAYRFAVTMSASREMGVTINALGTWATFEVTTEPMRYEILIDRDANDSIDIYPLSDDTLTVGEMQLTYGHEAFDWRPAPEDEDEVCDWTQTAIDEVTVAHLRSIQSRTSYYQRVLASGTAPAKPTTNPPGGAWTTTEPPLPEEDDGGLYVLYRCDVTVYSDGTFEWSDVSQATGYEAAERAAQLARTTSSELKQLSDSFETRVVATVVDTNTGGTVGSRLTDLTQTEDQVTRLIERVDKNAGDVEERIQLLQTSTARDITNIFTRSQEYTDELRQDVDDGYGAAKQYAETAQAWQRFSAEGIEQGALNSPFKSKLSATELGFYENNRKVSYINNNRFYITNGQIDDTLRIGQFMFAKSGNGLGLMNISGGTSA